MKSVKKHQKASDSDSDVVFIGWQETLSGDAVAFYNITAKSHPSYGSTVSDATLVDLNLQIPKRYRSGNKGMSLDTQKRQKKGGEYNMKDKWEIYKDAESHWRWRRTAPNGNIVGAATEGYVNKADCEGNARRNGWKD